MDVLYISQESEILTFSINANLDNVSQARVGL
jgi:hypothetical protein